jgi:hypothetical protein
MLNNLVGIYGVGIPASTNSYESIATAVGTGSSGTISFTAIPSTYTHLQLRSIARGTQSGAFTNMTLRVGNGSIDSGSNYTYHRLFGNGSAVTADGAASQTSGLFGITGTGAGSNTYYTSVIDFIDYKNTNKFKTLKSLDGYDNNGDGFVFLQSFLWRSTSAITNIELTLGGGQNITTASQFALYGIKG